MTVSAYKDDKSDFNDLEFFIDPSRCIGCQACVQACGECDTHRGTPMIHLDYVDRPTGVQRQHQLFVCIVRIQHVPKYALQMPLSKMIMGSF